VRAWLGSPGLRVHYGVGPESDFPTDRAFAYCMNETGEGGGISVVVAPDFSAQPHSRRAALMQHEFGHAIEYLRGRSFVLNVLHDAGFDLDVWGGTERRADALAEVVFGREIRYDTADVQTLGAGVSPRPRRLGGH
jgi:hypothetical protein